MFDKIGVSSSFLYHLSLTNRRSMQELSKDAGYADMRIECTEVNWQTPNLKSIVERSILKKLLPFASKNLDKSAARSVVNFGSEYFLICRTEPSERKEPT